jgi:hypothetical protein
VDIEVIGGIDHESFEFLRLVIDAARVIRKEYGIDLYVYPSIDLADPFLSNHRKGIRMGREVIYLEGETNREALIEMILSIYKGKRGQSNGTGNLLSIYRREPVTGAGSVSTYNPINISFPSLSPTSSSSCS